jgi:hypothetical protein
MMLVKMGVDYSRLEKPMRRALTVVDEVFKHETGDEAVLTSTYEGDHMAGSLHYANLAADFRISHYSHEVKDNIRLAVKKALSQRFGKLTFDVLFSASDTCLHVEYDPK